MIPAPEMEDYSQEIRGMVASIISSHDGAPFVFVDDEAIKLSQEVLDYYADTLNGQTMMMFAEWYNDMEYMKRRAVSHDVSYGHTMFCVLLPDGLGYKVSLFPVSYEEIFSSIDSMSVREYINLTNPDALEYEVSLFDDEEGRKTIKSVVRMIMMESSSN